MGEVRHRKSFSGREPFFVTIQLSMTVCPLEYFARKSYLAFSQMNNF